ncbi:pyrroloquinoline quinone biosynthesis protein PqqB [Amycolatopsis tolypomycina]|uniref:Coenzyme PQQ synthesis protein B n=1 Tax=Amycolatopsis tolypomycina TaxID=208445 RepID=A0A1H5BHH0_9PSEU|nr:pyrroloquinoline quinone biosynthesis protein PqqB [Amycolatopsis tolypomycina]SED54002.1 pyrroloquinoline quinone biosynthesis protein B [Amycolatopsis tolypomycina]
MKVILLGTAAGGGCPQWNCACFLCTADLPPRTQDCVAISADGAGWYLLNCSPDIRAQILGTPELRAGPGPREIPLRGVLLTDAELDHTLGLLMLRESGGLPVCAPPAVRSPVFSLVDSYGSWAWSSRADIPGLRVEMLPVSDKRPKYAASDSPGPWVVAYRITDPATGGVLVYAPCLRSWPAGFDEFVADASLVLLDGTFFAPDEMAGVGGPDQLAMGHLPITASLPRVAGRPWAFTHVNNTNPALDPASPEHAAVLAAGASLPPDGTRYTL